MDNQFVMISEIKTETQIFKFINLKTLFITIGFTLFGFLTSGAVHEMLPLLYIVFNGAVGFVLSMQSPFNKGKLVYQSVLLFIRNFCHKKLFIMLCRTANITRMIKCLKANLCTTINL